MTKRHVAKTGASAGQWVACYAEQQCRNGGTHISERTFTAVKTWLNAIGHPKVNQDITARDVNSFVKENPDPTKWDNLNQPTPVVVPVLPLVSKSLPVTAQFKPYDWEELKKAADDNNMKLSYTNAQEATFPSGRKHLLIENLTWEGTKENVERVEKLVAYSREQTHSMSLTAGEIDPEAWNEFVEMANLVDVEITHGEIRSVTNNGFLGLGSSQKFYVEGEIKAYGNKDVVTSLLTRLVEASSR